MLSANHLDTVAREPFVGTKRTAHGAIEAEYGPLQAVQAGIDVRASNDDERRGSGDARTVEGVVLFIPPATAVTLDPPLHKADRWRVDGELYVIDGVPQRPRNMFTGSGYWFEIELTRVEG